MGKRTGGTGIPHVIKKGTRYHYKRRWPTDLRAKNPTLPEFMERSLGTSDAKVAIAKASSLNLEYDQTVARLSNTPLAKVDPATAQAFVTRTVALLGQETTGADFPTEGDSLDGWELIPDPSGNPFLARAIHRDNKPIPPTPERSLERITALLQREMQSLRRVKDESASHSQRFKDQSDKLAAGISNILAMLKPLEIDLAEMGIKEEVPEQAKVTTLSDIADKWAANDPTRPVQHIDQYRYACRLFEQLHGKRDVRQITTLEISQFVEQLRLMPSSTKPEIRAADMKRAIELGKQSNLPTLSATTVNKHFSAIKTILTFAWEGGYINENPGSRLKVKRAKKANKQRDFTKDELSRLITALSKSKKPNEDDFWIPLVALFQGARREEVCQLEKSDVQDIDGIPCLNIRAVSDEDDPDTLTKSVKTTNSKRLTPVHPDLIKAGFLEFVKASNGSRVFATLEPDARGDLGAAYGKRFADILKDKAGIDVPRVKVFHSLRHTFITACRNAMMPETMEHTLSGHSSSHAVHDGYGSRQEVPLRLKWIAKVDFKVCALDDLIEQLACSRS